MSVIERLVTDRTAADAVRIRELSLKGFENMTDDERAEYLAPHKGAYNYPDLNRVAEALLYLRERLAGYGYHFEYPTEPKTDWTAADYPTPENMTEYLANVAAVRAVIGTYKTTPPVPADMEGLTYQEANDIEKILVDIEDLIEHMVASFVRLASHMFISGQRPFPSAVSDLGRTWEDLDAMETEWTNWQAADWYLLLYGDLTEREDMDDTAVFTVNGETYMTADGKIFMTRRSA